jgi:putative ABC transport system permease protein
MLVKLVDNANQDDFVNNAMGINRVLNVTSMDYIVEQSQWSTSSMDVIMYVIIIASGSLAFVVLYNLNSINISERIRELSTIKVLGFYDREVTSYINRENIVLTFLGIVFGCILGTFLYRFIIHTAVTTPSVNMLDTVNPFSYVLASLVTMAFAMIVSFIMHHKLKSIDMIDALKTVE